MLDIGWSELLVIGVVALIVVGPKDLPRMFRSLGQMTGKARRLAREFSTAMNAAADEAGVKDIKNIGGDLRKATSAKSMGLDGLEKAASTFDKWDPASATGRLSKERAEAAEKIRDATAKRALERQAREKAEAAAKAAGPAEAPVAPAQAAPAKRAAKKPAARKPAASKAAAEKPAATKPATKPAAGKPAASKAAAKPAARKPATKADKASKT